MSFATTTESSDILTFNNNNTVKQQQPHYFSNNPNNASSTSTSSSIIDRSDLMILNRTLNDNNPSIHVYETISVYGKNNEQHMQQAKIVPDAEFYNNCLLTSNNCIGAEQFHTRDGQKTIVPISFMSDHIKTFKKYGDNIQNDNKAYLTKFNNHFDEDNRIKNSKILNRYSNNSQNNLEQQSFQNMFLNVRNPNSFKPNTQNLFLTEAVV